MNLQSTARSLVVTEDDNFVVAPSANCNRYSPRIVTHLLVTTEALIIIATAFLVLKAPLLGHGDIPYAITSALLVGAATLLAAVLSGGASYDRFSSRLSFLSATMAATVILMVALRLNGVQWKLAVMAAAFVPLAALGAKIMTLSIRRWLHARGHLTRLGAVAADDPVQRSGLIKLLSQRDDVELVFVGSPSQFDALSELTRANQLDEIVLSGHQADAENIAALAGLAVAVVRVTPQDRLELNVFDPVWGKKRVFGGWNAPASIITLPPLRGWRGVTKRALDIMGSALAIIIFAPVLLVCAVAIKLDSPGPVLFTQERAGYRNKPFRMFKFRSMAAEKADTNGSQLTLRNDPRVTKVGNFMRRTSLDELPQLFNVLRGDMSLVGPRPHPKGAKAGSVLYDELIPNFYSRYRMKPGITGLAQVSGLRGNTETEQHLIDRFQRDMEYAAEWTPLLDLAILLRTVSHLAKGTNAF